MAPSSTGLIGELLSELLGDGSTQSLSSPTASSTGNASAQSTGSATSPTTLPVSVPTVPAVPTSSTGIIHSAGSTGHLGSGTVSMISPSVPVMGTSTSGRSSSVVPTPTSGAVGLTGSSTSGSSTPTPTPTSTPVDITSQPVSTTTERPSTTEISTTETTTETPIIVPFPGPDTTDFLPTTLVVQQPTPTTKGTATETETNTVTHVNTAPPQLPETISPPDGIEQPPANSVMVQLGFDEGFSYDFIVQNSVAASQIFKYIPQGLVFALGIQPSDVAVFTLRKYDNSQVSGYLAAVLWLYIPADQKETLRTMLHNPHSRLYDQPDAMVYSIMGHIDPSIPLDIGGPFSSLSSGGSSGGSSSGSNGGDGGNGENDSNSNNSSDAGASTSSNTKASSVGIGVGVVAGAAAYGAAMFWVARRYRKKRQSHRRASSIADQPGVGGSLFGGRVSRNSDHSGSNRTQMISAPVMAENSLGWN